MNVKLLQHEIQLFIAENLKSDINRLILKGSPFAECSVQELAQQIDSKKRCQHKLPGWFSAPGIYYPPKINIEQSSSEITAKYKADLAEGECIIDISGGMGVDAYYLAQKFEKLFHCEINEELHHINKHNFKQLKVANIESLQGDGLQLMKDLNQSFDCIYSDPARRDEQNNKLVLLSQCQPNIPENLDDLFALSPRILVKNSPLLDITNGIRELKHCKSIHILSYKNECKELLFDLHRDYNGPIEVICVNLLSETERQSFKFNFGETVNFTDYRNAEAYLYEPNASIMKSGAYALLGQTLKLGKLHQNSHLYTSEQLLPDFPGRSFKIVGEYAYDKKALKKVIPSMKANISVRNFKATVDQIRKKTGFKEGGKDYLFFTTNKQGKPIVLHTIKVNQ